MRTCVRCGRPMPDNAVQCPACGMAQPGKTPKQPGKPAAKRNLSTILVFAALALGLLVFVVGLAVWLSSREESPDPSDSGPVQLASDGREPGGNRPDQPGVPETRSPRPEGRDPEPGRTTEPRTPSGPEGTGLNPGSSDSKPEETSPNPVETEARPSETAPKPSETESARPTETSPEPAAPTESQPPVQADWSGWSQELPAYVDNDHYEIQTRTLYSSSRLELTTSASSSLSGWELYDTVTASGAYGPWSDWSTEAPAQLQDREIQTAAESHYRDRETTTSTAPSLSGWDLIGSEEVYGDSYGPWSEWSETPAYASDTREVNVRTQYRYRDPITMESEEIPDGNWVVEWTEVRNSDWSDWIDGWYQGSLIGRECEDRDLIVGTRYHITHYCTGARGLGGSGVDTYSTWPLYKEGATYHDLGWFEDLSSFRNEGQASPQWTLYGYYPNNSSQRYRCSNTCYFWYITETEDVTRHQYRLRERHVVYHLSGYTDWSDWQSEPIEHWAGSDVVTRELYQYRDRQKQTLYTYSRWTPWSAWTTEYVAEGPDRQTESRTVYCFRDRVTETTYCFRRWTPWSEYSESPVTASESVQVRTRKEYRFRSR